MTLPPAAKLGKTLELACLTWRDASEMRYLSGSITVMSWMGDSIKPCLR